MGLVRGFEKVSYYKGDVLLPTRGSEHSAGYDLYLPEDMNVLPNSVSVMPLGIKAYMWDDEFLQIHIRSSMGLKNSLMIANTTGIIDSDYYNNEDNEGQIIIALYNYGDKVVELKKGDRIAQGIFLEYKTVGDEVNEKRVGGIGSTDQK